MRWQRIKFILLFLFYIFLFSLPMVIDSRWNSKQATISYNSFIATVAVKTYNLFPVTKAVARDNLISSGKTAVRIESGCNGVLMSIIFLAAVSAFPAPWRYRLFGITLGMAAIFIFNIVRVDVLFLILGKWPTIFETAHITAAQFVGIIFSLTLWIFWIDGLAKD